MLQYTPVYGVINKEMDEPLRILYCCGVLEAQKKIWHQGFLRKYSGATIAKTLDRTVTHIVCGRSSETAASVGNILNLSAASDSLKIVHAAWLSECAKLNKRVSESAFIVPLGEARDPLLKGKSYAGGEEGGSDPSSKRRRLGADEYLPQSAATIQIGRYRVGAFGVGTLAWGVSYPDPDLCPAEDAVPSLINAAIQATAPHPLFLDTADTYCRGRHDVGYMERVLNEACRDKSVIIGTKGGMVRIGSESNSWREANYTTSAEWENCIRASLERLNYHSDPLPLWMVHHCKKNKASLEALMTACQVLVRENRIVHIGLCNVTVAEVEFCQKFLPIACVQNKYSLYHRIAEKPLHVDSSRVIASNTQRGMIDYCTEKQIPFLAYGVLGGVSARRGDCSLKVDFPEIARQAHRKGVAPQILVLAWIRHRFPIVMPLVGSRSIQKLTELRKAYEVRFSAEDMLDFPTS